MSAVLTRVMTLPPVNEREALCYAGCRKADAQTEKLLADCAAEALPVITGQVCYTVLPVTVTEDGCDFGAFSVTSKHLAKNLQGCTRVLLFAATVGVGLDRLIAKYSRISPAKALMMQALGAERIEALCDAFCDAFAAEEGTTLQPRFSPGYGDLPLDAQQDLFALLDCPRKIGLTLTQSLLMSPSKSVTAFAGIGGTCREQGSKCAACDKTNCQFRGTI